MSEEISRRARSLVESLPEEARVIGLAAASPADPAAHAAAAGIARAMEGGRTGLLANLAGPGCGLDGHLGVSRTEGLETMFGEGRRLGHVTVRPEGLGMLYLPAGATPVTTSDPGTEGGPRLRPEVGSALRRLAERLREAGATFLLFLPADLLGDPVLEEVLDGVIRLGDAPAGPEPVRTRPPTLGRLAPGAESGEESGEEGAWRRRRREEDFPIARVVGGAAVVAFLFGGWWLLASRAATGGGSGGETHEAAGTAAETATAGRTAMAAETIGSPGGTTGPPDADPARGPSPEAILGEAPELGYSVLVASYSRLEAAARGVEGWTGDGVPYLIAPTRIEGGVYHRVYAGALPTPDAGRRLMGRLVEAGRKEEARGWDVRPTRLAFRLGVFRDRDRADSGLASIREDGIPAYRVAAAVAGDTVHALFAGAYEAEAAAAPLRELLRDAGVDAELVLRRGSPLTP